MEHLLFCSRLCELSYRQVSYIEENRAEIMLTHDLKDIKMIKVENARAIVCLKDNTIFVAVKGTDSLNDVRHDVQCGLTELRLDEKVYGFVHRGFYKYANKLWPAVQAEIDCLMGKINEVRNSNTNFSTLRTSIESPRDMFSLYVGNGAVLKIGKANNIYSKKSICFTGHSLGGCAMILAMQAAILYQIPRSRLQCVTFGAPKIGDRTFVKNAIKHISAIHRIIHTRDVIPTLPISYIYKHVPGTMTIDAETNMVVIERNGFIKWLASIMTMCMTKTLSTGQSGSQGLDSSFDLDTSAPITTQLAHAEIQSTPESSAPLAVIGHEKRRGSSVTTHSLATYIAALENIVFYNPDELSKSSVGHYLSKLVTLGHSTVFGFASPHDDNKLAIANNSLHIDIK